MKISSNNFFSSIIAAGIVFNFLVVFNVQFFLIRELFSFAYLMIVPGLLVMVAAKIKDIGFWQYLVYVIATSTAFIMFAGLGVNWLLPWLEIADKPLLSGPLLGSFDAIILVLILIARKMNRSFSPDIKPLKLSGLSVVFFAVAAIFPVLSVLGAVILNNGGSNYLTMIMLGGMAVYVPALVCFRKKLDGNIYPWSLLTIGTALLLMSSMRSWHISGWDIYQEFEIFQVTKNLGFWIAASNQNAYNTCLSLTILPTALSRFAGINDEYIYKFIYQLIFGFAPLALYYFYRNFASRIISFLAAFFFVSQIFFIQQMPSLARQEMAFLFFGLILMALFSRNLSARAKNAFFIFFGFSMVVSHYSTAYIAIALFAMSYALLLVYKKARHTKLVAAAMAIMKSDRANKSAPVSNIKIIPLLALVAFAFFWEMALTDSSGNLVALVKDTVGNMGQIFSNDLKSADLRNSLSFFSLPNDNTAENIEKFNADMARQFEFSTDRYEPYGGSFYPVSAEIAPPQINLPYSNVFLIFLSLLKLLSKIFAIIGLVYIFFSVAGGKGFGGEYFTLCVFGIGAILAMFILPVISQGYNLSRLYMQILMLVSLPTIYGGYIILNFLNDNLRLFLLSSFFAVYLLYILGFFFQILGGPAYMHLNNYGDDYEKFYTHKTEISAAAWLAKNENRRSMIFADNLSLLRLNAFGLINNVTDIVLPSVITRDSYVYLRRANAVNGRTDAHYKNMDLIYNYPIDFLDQSKNLIYDNGGSKIFK